MRTKGKITSWDDHKGYGFISPSSGEKQLFIHIKAFSNRNQRPVIGQTVRYEVSTDQRGRPCAIKARLSVSGIQWINNSNNIPIVIAIVFFSMVALSVIADKIPLFILVAYFALSLLTYFFYAADKSAAKKGAWRTQESTLHLLALAGGWPGALIAQQQLRHKSKKKSFRFVFFITVLLNCGALIGLYSDAGSTLLHKVISSQGSPTVGGA